MFSGGTGTSGDPYLIGTPADLDDMRNMTSAYYYEQIADIDLSGYANWVPIGGGGDGSNFFPMTRYLGKYYRITGLNINRPQDCAVGLFGGVMGPSDLNLTISGVIIEGANVVGDVWLGVLVGHVRQRYPRTVNLNNIIVRDSTISGTYNSSSLAGGSISGRMVGAIFGTLSTNWSTRQQFTANSLGAEDCTVTGVTNVGGLFGGSSGVGTNRLGNNNLRLNYSYARGVTLVFIPYGDEWVMNHQYNWFDYVIGTDGFTYRCSNDLPADATTDNTPYRPITGASWSEYFTYATTKGHGGLLGRNHDGQTSYQYFQCYVADCTMTPETGRVFSGNEDPDKISSCYHNSDIETDAGEKRTKQQMQYPRAEGTYTIWTFGMNNTDWWTEPGENDGFPYRPFPAEVVSQEAQGQIGVLYFQTVYDQPLRDYEPYWFPRVVRIGMDGNDGPLPSWNDIVRQRVTYKLYALYDDHIPKVIDNDYFLDAAADIIETDKAGIAPTPINTDITTPEDVFNMMYASPGKVLTLQADINLSSFSVPAHQPFDWDMVYGFETGSFIPIYNFSYYSGSGVFLNGNGFKIKSLYVHVSEEYEGNQGLGLFDYISGGKIEDLVIEDADIRGRASYFVGILSGGAYDGSEISRVAVLGTITDVVSGGNQWYIGGLVGSFSSDGLIEECYAAVDIDQENTLYRGVGGLVGECWRYDTTKIFNCYARGHMRCDDSVGGLVGSNTGLIENCYAAVDIEVTGADHVGGLVGWVGTSSGYQGATVNSYFDNFWVEGGGAGRGEPRSTAQMKMQEEDQETYVDWDFDEIWGITPVHNDGYPILEVIPPFPDVWAVITAASHVYSETTIFKEATYTTAAAAAITKEASSLHDELTCIRESTDTAAHLSYIREKTILERLGIVTVKTLVQDVTGRVMEAIVIPETVGHIMEKSIAAESVGYIRESTNAAESVGYILEKTAFARLGIVTVKALVQDVTGRIMEAVITPDVTSRIIEAAIAPDVTSRIIEKTITRDDTAFILENSGSNPLKFITAKTRLYSATGRVVEAVITPDVTGRIRETVKGVRMPYIRVRTIAADQIRLVREATRIILGIWIPAQFFVKSDELGAWLADDAMIKVDGIWVPAAGFVKRGFFIQ